MSLANTFTSAIVREIGRNYGKAISNSLMGNSHSTPVRVVGDSLSRMRGRVYRNAFDEAVTKFSIKGATSTFNQALNIHSEYFTLVEEAKMDGTIDILELEYLVNEWIRAVQVLKRAKQALEDHEDKRAEKVSEKIQDLVEFKSQVDESLVISQLPAPRPWYVMMLGFILSFVGLDVLIFGKTVQKIVSITLLAAFVSFGLYYNYPKLAIGFYLFFYNLFNVYASINGFWRARKQNRAQKDWNKRAIAIKKQISEL
jgi:hypothetical protein